MKEIIIGVYKGVARVERKPKGIKVIIIDRDKVDIGELGVFVYPKNEKAEPLKGFVSKYLTNISNCYRREGVNR